MVGAASGGIVLLWGRARRLARGGALLAVAAGIALPATLPDHWLRPHPSPYKGLSLALTAPDARIVAERHGPLGWIAAVESPTVPFRHAPGLSLMAPVGPPAQIGPLHRRWRPHRDHPCQRRPALSGGRDRRAPLPHAGPSAAGAGARRRRRGGGAAGAAPRRTRGRCGGAEPGRARHRARRAGGRAGGLVGGREVSACMWPTPAASPRVRPNGGTSFRSRWWIPSARRRRACTRSTNRCSIRSKRSEPSSIDLRPDGVLAVTRWLKLPPRDALKLLWTARAALEKRGVADPASRLVMIRGWKTTTLVIGGPTVRPACNRRVASVLGRLCVRPGLAPGDRGGRRQPPQQDRRAAILSGRRRHSRAPTLRTSPPATNLRSGPRPTTARSSSTA